MQFFYVIFLLLLILESMTRFWNVRDEYYNCFLCGIRKRTSAQTGSVILSGIVYATLAYLAYYRNYSPIKLYLLALFIDTTILYFNRPMDWYISTWSIPMFLSAWTLLFNVYRPILG